MSSCRPGWLRQSCTIKNRGSGVRTRSSPIGSAHVIVHRGFGKKMGFQVLLAHLSLRVRGELIVYRSSRRPSVCASVCPCVHTFIHEYL